MRFIGQLFVLPWDTARRGNRVSYGRGPAVLYTILFLFFMVVGLILVALGFDLQRVDVWLDARSTWFLLIGDILWRMLCALVLLMCGLGILTLVRTLGPKPQAPPHDHETGRQHKHPAPTVQAEPSVAGTLFSILLCLTIGYFAFIGVIWVD